MALGTTNISVSLVRDEIGAVSNDVGTLCTHPNVNKWSKWKPIRSSKLGGITLSDLAAVNYGILVNNYSSIDAVKAAYTSEFDVWTYLTPRGGGTNEYFRLGDFRNYDKDATPIVGGSNVTPFVSNEDGSDNTIVGSLFVSETSSGTGLSWGDLVLGGRRLGLALYDGSTLVRTGLAPVGARDVAINTRTPTVLTAKNYAAVFFLSNTSGGTTSNVGGVPAQPMFGHVVRVISGTGVTVTMRGIWDETLTDTIYISIKASNKTVGVATLTDCTIKVRNWQNSCPAPLETEEKQINIGTLTVPPMTSTEIYNTVTTVDRDAYGTWKLCWSNTGIWETAFEGAILMVDVD